MTLNKQPIKAKIKTDFLGDRIHEEGVSESAEATVKQRYGRIINTMLEISEFLKDFRINTVGGLKSGLVLYEMVIVPSLLYNCDTWFLLKNHTVKTLENLQLKMFRILFAVPDSAPIPLMRFDLGTVTILERIHIQKLKFLHFLKSLSSSSLASEIYHLQVKYGFRGIVTESRELITTYKLPNIIDDDSLSFSKKQWNSLVKNAVKEKSESDVKEQFRKYSKLNRKEFENEGLKMKDYICNMSLSDARTTFRVRSSTLPFKMNMKSDRKASEVNWRCDSCFSSNTSPGLTLCPETTSHVLLCPAYAPLREGLSLDSDLDVAKYFQAVLKIRQEEDKQTSSE